MHMLKAALLMTLLAAPVAAQEWQRFEDSDAGYSIEVPADFVPSDDGLGFVRPGKVQKIMVWSGSASGSFEAAVSSENAVLESDAWAISGQTVTPRWAEVSGIKGIQTFTQRMIVLCDGAGYAAFRAEYSVADAVEMEPVIAGLTRSLQASC